MRKSLPAPPRRRPPSHAALPPLLSGRSGLQDALRGGLAAQRQLHGRGVLRPILVRDRFRAPALDLPGRDLVQGSPLRDHDPGHLLVDRFDHSFVDAKCDHRLRPRARGGHGILRAVFPGHNLQAHVPLRPARGRVFGLLHQLQGFSRTRRIPRRQARASRGASRRNSGASTRNPAYRRRKAISCSIGSTGPCDPNGRTRTPT